MTRALTVGDVADLRFSVKSLPRITVGEAYPNASIIWDEVWKRWLLLHRGIPACAHKDPLVLAQMAKCEGAEPGYVLRILNPMADPDVATRGLDPYTLALEQRNLWAETVRGQQEAADERRRLARRAGVLDPSKIDLDSL